MPRAAGTIKICIGSAGGDGGGDGGGGGGDGGGLGGDGGGEGGGGLCVGGGGLGEGGGGGGAPGEGVGGGGDGAGGGGYNGSRKAQMTKPELVTLLSVDQMNCHRTRSTLSELSRGAAAQRASETHNDTVSPGYTKTLFGALVPE